MTRQTCKAIPAWTSTSRRTWVIVLACLLVAARPAVTATQATTGDRTAGTELQALGLYRAELDAFRKEYGGGRDLPDVPFFQFGMGMRTKQLFRNGALRDPVTGTILRQWDATNTIIVPPEYAVFMATRSGGSVRVFEDEQGVWIDEQGRKALVEGTSRKLHLPAFEGHRYGSILRVLHHEILINLIEGRPVPNLYVYRKPWYRDGAMIAMCLKATGNLELIRDWVLGLTEPYDRNNAGQTEADNLGQVLFLVSCVADKAHPLVAKVLKEVPKFEVHDPRGVYIKGSSDFSEHPVYQTKWLKYGLRSLGLEDPYWIPSLADSYSSLFWMDYRDRHVAGTEAADRNLYPYLGWATDHFQRRKLSPISNRDYPLTWEMQASQANYAGMKVIDPVFAEQKIATPHTWHAAEVFLYLLDPLLPQ